jgi:hypothetical protein
MSGAKTNARWANPFVSAAARHVGRVFLVFVAAAVVVTSGCRSVEPFPASLNSSRPEERVRAAKKAVDYPYASPAERQTALELLVWRLDDEDDCVRFFAILALERMTGTRLGYEYHAPAYERLRAVQSWRRYLAEQAKAAQRGGDAKPTAPTADANGSAHHGGSHP